MSTTTTFPLTFRAPSEAVQALVTSGTRLDFIRAWRAEAEVNVQGLRVVPGLKLCTDYFDALRKGFPAMAVVISNRVEARKSIGLNLQNESDSGDIPRRLHEAGLR